jgi:hypothetical protein
VLNRSDPQATVCLRFRDLTCMHQPCHHVICGRSSYWWNGSGDGNVRSREYTNEKRDQANG